MAFWMAFLYIRLKVFFLHFFINIGFFDWDVPPITVEPASSLLDMVCGTVCICTQSKREHSGSVVECLTRDRRAAGLSLTGVTALWSLSKTHLS